MSSRALRRLQANSGITDLGPQDIEEDGSTEDSPPKRSSKSKKKQREVVVNPFELLQEDGVNEEGDLEESENENEEERPPPTDQVKVIKKRKKKNKKKGKDNSEQSNSLSAKQNNEDEVEASVQEVNRLLGEPSPVVVQRSDASGLALSMKPLLHIDYRNLNPENEMRRMFGSDLFRGEQHQRNRRQRNRPILRSTKLVQPKDTWHSTGGCGLSMKFLSEKEGFIFEHSPAYQKLQHKFLDGIESGHPENIFSNLQDNPYHIDTLITLADFYSMNEDFQTGAECIEKALYGMECAFHSMFNLAAGNCYLDFKRRENRCFYICLFKHIVNLGRRGCNRTAFEFCKLLLSLDPVNDPLNCLSMIDYYALRSEQYDYLIRLEAEVSYTTSQLQTPNFAFSVSLAHYKTAMNDGSDYERADKMLQDRLLLYPMMLLPLLDKCSVQPDSRVEKHKFLSTLHLDSRSSELKRLISLYTNRCEACWKEPAVMSWLERNVSAVLDIVDRGEDPRMQDYANRRHQQFKHPPPSIIRHYSLSGIPVPAHITTRAMYTHDPYPPTDSIDAYPRPPRPTRAASNDQSMFRLLLQSLMPSYNPNEVATEPQPALPVVEGEVAVGAEAGARAIPHQLQESVNAIMDAMRNLLNNAVAMEPPPGHIEEVVDEENERGWEEEEDDYNNQQH